MELCCDIPLICLEETRKTNFALWRTSGITASGAQSDHTPPPGCLFFFDFLWSYCMDGGQIHQKWSSAENCRAFWSDFVFYKQKFLGFFCADAKQPEVQTLTTPCHTLSGATWTPESPDIEFHSNVPQLNSTVQTLSGGNITCSFLTNSNPHKNKQQNIYKTKLNLLYPCLLYGPAGSWFVLYFWWKSAFSSVGQLRACVSQRAICPSAGLCPLRLPFTPICLIE